MTAAASIGQPAWTGDRISFMLARRKVLVAFVLRRRAALAGGTIMRKYLAALGAALTATALSACGPSAPTHDQQVARGQYLVKIIGCSGCHTPGATSAKPDMARFLGGADASFILPGLGTFVPPNLTPDKGTGLGTWTTAQIAAAITTGATPSGRTLSPAMPWSDFANLTKDDATDIALYLQSLPAVSHAVPGPTTTGSCGSPSLAECVAQAGAPPTR
jgi:mono/diheme cytochrome c family protein